MEADVIIEQHAPYAGPEPPGTCWNWMRKNRRMHLSWKLNLDEPDYQ